MVKSFFVLLSAIFAFLGILSFPPINSVNWIFFISSLLLSVFFLLLFFLDVLYDEGQTDEKENQTHL